MANTKKPTVGKKSVAKSKKVAGVNEQHFGIERAGLGGYVNEGKLPFAFPTKELANDWLQFAAKLGADFGTYACSGGMCEYDYSVVKSEFGYAVVDSPDAEKDYYLQKFKLVDVSGLPVLSCKPSEMTVEQAKALLGFLFIDEEGDESDWMGIYASRLLRCLNTDDEEAYNNGYELFDPTCCYWDEKEIVLQKGIAEIGEMEYQCARNLESVVIPEGVVKIGPAAFYHCRKLNTVKFPSTLKEIGKRAFEGCDALVGLKLPKGVEKVGAHAFDDKWYGNQKVLECSDLSVLSDYSWRNLIVEHPELGDRCTCWNKFDSSDWEDILKVAPQFAAKCKKWGKFSGYEIVRVLKAQPQLISKWKSLSQLDASDWSSLLRERPEFADHCTKWNKFDSGDWSRLLTEQPQFADRCKAWAQFEDCDWDRVMKKGAKFKKLRKEFGPKQLSGYPADYVRGEAKGLYCVIDVSGGKDVAKFPVSYLDAIPDGGWSDEYKTSKIVLRLVAPTTFAMGAKGVNDNPVHQVELTRPYYIGVFEVTQKQWELVMGRNPAKYDEESDSEMRPVEQVSYRRIRGEKLGAKWPVSASVDNDSFLGILRKKSGIKNIDLPTEAEWTCACKPGIVGLNRDAVEGLAWTDGNSGEETHPVGELAPNGLGLYDILGNVWEWCIDRYGPFAQSKVSDPIGYSVSSNFVSHGACCYNGSYSMNSSNRNSDSASETGSGLGLRLCFTLEKASKALLQKASEIKEVRILGNWAKLTAHNWRDLLEAQPQFADKCDKWDAFDGYDWSWILSKQPQFADRCDKWSAFDGSDWRRVLTRQQQFADRGVAWGELGASDWAKLLAAQPQFADKCDKFGIFDYDDWAALLESQPQFIDRVYDCVLNESLMPWRWRKILIHQPQLIDHKYYNNPLLGMDDIDLALLAAAHERFVDKFLAKKNPSAWAIAIALSGRPELASKFKLDKLTGADVDVEDRILNDELIKDCVPGIEIFPCESPAATLLRNQPQFADRITLTELSGADWLCVLSKQPQLSDKCDWEKVEREYEADIHGHYLNDELVKLIRRNTDIDVEDGIDIYAYVEVPCLAREFDADDWEGSQTEKWCRVLTRYPELAARFEKAHVKPDKLDKPDSEHSDEKKKYSFGGWNDWGDSKWAYYEQLLAKHDPVIDDELQKVWDDGIDDYGQLGGVEAGLDDFFRYACKRSTDWIRFADDYELFSVFNSNPSLVKEPKVERMLIDYCNAGEESDGYYVDDDCCVDENGGWVNRWAYVLMEVPQLSVHCTSFQKFNGYSRCMLIISQPQFAEKFSLEELGDPNGACWSTCSDSYHSAWDALVDEHPEFAKYRKG